MAGFAIAMASLEIVTCWLENAACFIAHRVGNVAIAMASFPTRKPSLAIAISRFGFRDR
jgi:hypothetical protein